MLDKVNNEHERLKAYFQTGLIMFLSPLPFSNNFNSGG